MRYDHVAEPNLALLSCRRRSWQPSAACLPASVAAKPRTLEGSTFADPSDQVPGLDAQSSWLAVTIIEPTTSGLKNKAVH